MAQGRRVERVAALIRREVSELLVNGIRDERVHQGMVSVTGVEVAGDLQHCRIRVSVLGSEEERQQVLEGLKAASSYVKGELSRRLKMRRTPDVVFQIDRGLERGTAVLGLLNRLEEERRERGEIPAGNIAEESVAEGGADFGDDDDLEEDDENDGPSEDDEA
ncbi:30S ribosome-binding factor RbfA [Cyanobium sp. FGCU-6]|jgi:ribosome-binding factor A|nr:30S ribosome-binding factor RbfA [Cyanobium sp. FGCU6]